jgi:hypothetical protein
MRLMRLMRTCACARRCWPSPRFCPPAPSAPLPLLRSPPENPPLLSLSHLFVRRGADSTPPPLELRALSLSLVFFTP